MNEVKRLVAPTSSMSNLPTMAKLLTIAIPTYNRRAYVCQLVPVLCADAARCRDQLRIVVSDNASTDGTADALRALQSDGFDFDLIERSINIGMDGNFTETIAQVDTRYCWLLGDDDVPVPGTLPKVVATLASAEPDMLYLRSAWFPDAFKAQIPSPDLTIPSQLLDDVEFAGRVHYWLTFISGVVFDLAHYRRIAPAGPPDEFLGTMLAQMHWVLLLLRHGKRFMVSAGPVVKATGNNSGGYSLAQVFGVNLPRLVDLSLGPTSRPGRIIKRRNTLSNLPRLLHTVRYANLGNFKLEALPHDFLGQGHHSKTVTAMYRTILGGRRRNADVARITLLALGKALGEVTDWHIRMRGAWLNAGRIIEGVPRRVRRVISRLRGALWSLRTGTAGDHPAWIGSGGQYRGLRGIRMHGPLNVGLRCRIELYDRYAAQRFSPLLLIGADVSMENDCHIAVVDRVEIHDGVMIGSRVYISDHAHGDGSAGSLMTMPVRRPLHSKGPVIIERNAWIGQNVTILPGVRIGQGAIIGANSVVTRDVPAATIAAGCPARALSH